MHVPDIHIYDNVKGTPQGGSSPSASFLDSPGSLGDSSVSDFYLSPASSPKTEALNKGEEREKQTGLRHLLVLSNQSSPSAYPS